MGSKQRSLINSIAKEELPDIESFINRSFLEVLVAEGKQPDETQARAKITGDTYEDCISVLLDYFAPDVTYERYVDLPKAHMTGTAGADFVIYESDEKENIHTVIEAKGSAEKLDWPEGPTQEFTRAGLRRSDTMKKAVCQAYQVDQTMDTNFHILTTHKPKKNSSSYNVANIAEGDIIDGIIDTTDLSEFNSFIDTLPT